MKILRNDPEVVKSARQMMEADSVTTIMEVEKGPLKGWKFILTSNPQQATKTPQGLPVVTPIDLAMVSAAYRRGGERAAYQALAQIRSDRESRRVPVFVEIE